MYYHKPNPFVLDKEKVGGTFALGYNVFDYSETNISFVFSGSRVSHCTGVPHTVMKMPKVLQGDKSFKTVNDQKGAVCDYLKKIVVT